MNNDLDSSMRSIESYCELSKAIKNKYKEGIKDILEEKKLGFGSFKKALLNEFKDINVKNNKVVTFVEMDKNNENNNKLYKFTPQEVIFNAFLQVLDGNSPKIISPSSQTYMGKDLYDTIEQLGYEFNKDNKHILASVLLYSLLSEHNLFCDKKNKFYIQNFYNGLLSSNNKENNDIKSFLSKLFDIVKKKVNYFYKNGKKMTDTEDLCNTYKDIFTFLQKYYYNKDNTFFNKEQKEQVLDYANQLFFLVLFTNKTDIKIENALFDETNNKITNIDITIEKKAVNKYGFLQDINETGYKHQYERSNLINKIFLSTSFSTIVNKDNPAFEKYLRQYTLDEEKIKAIVRQATENLDRIGCKQIEENITTFLNLFLEHQKRIKNMIEKEEKPTQDNKEQFEKLLEVLNNNIAQLDIFIKDFTKIENTVNYALTRQKNIKKKFLKTKREIEEDTKITKMIKNFESMKKEEKIHSPKANIALYYKKTKSSSCPSCPCFSCNPQEEEEEIVFDQELKPKRNRTTIINNDTIKENDDTIKDYQLIS